MAQRRMFSPEIVASDAFVDMPVSVQALYFHLGMKADDDGFVNPNVTMRMIGANGDDLRVLIAKRFVLPFENGVIVIKHWRINNFIRKDRYHETMYLEQKKMLRVKENGAYTLDKSQGKPIAKVEWKSDYEVMNSQKKVKIPSSNQSEKEGDLRLKSGQPLVNQRSTEVRLGKVRLYNTPSGEGEVVQKPNHQVKDVINYFFLECQKKFGVKPEIKGEQDGMMAKNVLKKYSFEDVKRLIDFYLGGEKIEKFGFNLSVALSKDTINRWLFEEKATA
ncbi:MAG: hypothetical protein [Siphoviridae sp. cttb18]|nr:MAG: hypothetical protein [Siphoviridae sp. cttb18]